MFRKVYNVVRHYDTYIFERESVPAKSRFATITRFVNNATMQNMM